MRCSTALVTVALLAAACTAKPRTQAAGREEPWTAAPADVSHGEAPVGSTSAPAPVDPRAPEPSTSRLVKVRFETRHAKVAIAPGILYEAWTFGGRVPGPGVRVTVGDTVDFTLVNRAEERRYRFFSYGDAMLIERQEA